MRYYQANWTIERDRCPNIDTLDYLYETFEKNALVCPNRSIGLHGDDYLFGVSVVCLDDQDEQQAQAYFEQACSQWDIRAPESVEVEECTVNECFHIENRFHWRHDTRNLYQIAHLFELEQFVKTPEAFRESLVAESLREDEALARAGTTVYAGSLAEEVRRICAPRANEASRTEQRRIPMHYLMEGASPARYEPALDVLLSTLLGAERLPSRHVFHIDVDRAKDRLLLSVARTIESVNERFAESVKGNILVIEYGRFDEDRAYEDNARKLLAKLLDTFEPYFDSMLVVFLVPPGKADLKRRLKTRLGRPVVELREDSRTDGMTETTDDSEQAMRLEQTLEAFPQYRTVFGETALEAGERCSLSARQRLEELIGLEEPKRLIGDILARTSMNRELERVGLPVQPLSLHMAFVGAPGTGKTEVAQLFGQILKEEGILSEGRVVTVSGAEFWNVKDAFDAARGSVLFVDEAYGMLGRSDKITQLIALMESRRSDTVVILAGYQHETDRLLDANPGFRSRLGFTIEFPDYTDDELIEIFQLMCRRAGLRLSASGLRRLRDLLARGGKRNDRGNARFVRKLFEDAVGAQQVRLARSKPEGDGYRKRDLQTILPEDLGYRRTPRRARKSARRELEELIGLNEVKHLVSERLDLARVQKVKRDAGIEAPYVPLHMAFEGNPGTGKTEVARLMGRIMKEEGILSVGDFYECGRQDLVGKYVGHTAPLVASLFERAKGSVIFIDEAYALLDGQRGSFGDEAIAAIVDQVEKLRDDVVVIFAGYPREIDALLSANPGLRSRVTANIAFPDYSVDELLRIAVSMAKKHQVHLDRAANEKIRRILEQAARQENFGNARFVRNLLEGAIMAQASRLASMLDSGESPSKRQLTTLLARDFTWNPPADKPSIGFVG